MAQPLLRQTRMVLEFGRDELQLTSAQLAELQQRVHNGDLSLVMRSFEGDMRTPIKGMLFGLPHCMFVRVEILAQFDRWHAAHGPDPGAKGEPRITMMSKVSHNINHQTKVDVEIAMSALDKIMRANEFDLTLTQTLFLTYRIQNGAG